MVATRKNKSSRLRYSLVAIFVVLILAGVGSLIALHIHNVHDKQSTSSANAGKRSTSVNYSPSSSTDNTANNNRKASTAPSQTLNDQPSAPSAATPVVTIVSASVNNGNLHVGTQVSGVTSGTCTLTATQNGQQISLATATVQQDVNSYDCGVFNVSTSKFPGSGQWVLTLAVTSNGEQGNTTTNVNIPTGS